MAAKKSFLIRKGAEAPQEGGRNVAKHLFDLEALEGQLLQLQLEKMVQRAYEQGVAEAQRKLQYPYVLKKEHLAEIFQVKPATVDKLVGYQNFPHLGTTKGRYPRDRVFDWIDANTEYLNQYLS